MLESILPLLAQSASPGASGAASPLAIAVELLTSPSAIRFGKTWGVAVVVAIVVAVIYKAPPSAITGRRVSFLRRLVQWQLFALLAALVLQFQLGEVLAKEKRQFKLYEDTLYLPSPRTVKLVALGYDEALASGLFIRSIQAYGGGWQFTGKGGRPRLFEHYFDLITDLDPHFERAYTYGNMMVGEEMRNPGAGLALMVKGLHKFTDNWRIPFEAGFFAQDRLDDYARAVKYFQVAVERPDVPGWVDRHLTFYAIKGGQFRGGIERFLRLYLASIENGSDVELHIGRHRLVRTQIDWGDYLITQAMEQYREQTGQRAESLDVLLDMPALADYEYVDLTKIFPRNEIMARPGDPLYRAITPNVAEIADPSRSLTDQIDRFADRIFIRLQRQIPPAPDGQGWVYDPYAADSNSRRDFILRPSGDMESASFMMLLRGQLADLLVDLGTIPASLDTMREGMNAPIPADPDGTFIFYNPETGSVAYAKEFIVPEW